MSIPDTLLRTAIRATTANGRESPNTYRILSWLYGCMLIDGTITLFSGHSSEFDQVCSYLEEHYNIKTLPTRETGAAYEFIPVGERVRTPTGRIPAPRLNSHEKHKYQQFVKGVFSRDTKS